MKKIIIIAALATSMLVSCKRYEVVVQDTTGRRLKNAEVYLSYVSDPRPPRFVTDENGIATIPSNRAKSGGWAMIIASYHDQSGKRYQGSHDESKPAFPVTITVTPR